MGESPSRLRAPGRQGLPTPVHSQLLAIEQTLAHVFRVHHFSLQRSWRERRSLVAKGCPWVIHRDARGAAISAQQPTCLTILLSPLLRISDFTLELMEKNKLFHLFCLSVKARRGEDARNKWVPRGHRVSVSCLGLGGGEKPA